MALCLKKHVLSSAIYVESFIAQFWLCRYTIFYHQGWSKSTAEIAAMGCWNHVHATVHCNCYVLKILYYAVFLHTVYCTTTAFTHWLSITYVHHIYLQNKITFVENAPSWHLWTMYYYEYHHYYIVLRYLTSRWDEKQLGKYVEGRKCNGKQNEQ